MNQNSVIFGALFVGFLVYITIRGELPKYVAIFTTSGAKSKATNTNGTPTMPGITPAPNTIMPGTLGDQGITSGQAQEPSRRVWNWLNGLIK